MSNPLLFRRLLGGILIVALIVVVAVTVRFFIESSRKEKPASFQFGADIGLKAIHFTENEAGRKKWELFAERGEYDKASEKSTLSGIRFIVESDRKGPVTVTARQGEYFHSTRYLILKGGIVARTKDGASFETPGLTYNSKTRIFNTKEHVSFADKGLKVEGVGMDFTVDGFEAKIHSRVSATLDPGMREK